MNPVIQLETTGCGIASAAALAGVSYSTMKSVAKAMDITAEDPKLWSDTAYVRKLLKHYEVKTGVREVPFRSWHEIPNLALLSIKWHRKKNQSCWHWVVFVREKGGSYILDPKRNLRNHYRTDLGRIKPKWYIEVST